MSFVIACQRICIGGVLESPVLTLAAGAPETRAFDLRQSYLLSVGSTEFRMVLFACMYRLARFQEAEPGLPR